MSKLRINENSIKIPQLKDAGNIENNDLVIVEQVGGTRKATVGNLTKSINDKIETNKTNITNLSSQLDNNTKQIDILKPKIDSLASGSPKATFGTLALLQSDVTANTIDGKKYIYIVSADGGWYYWNGSDWTKGGTYQSTGIADGSILPSKTTFCITSMSSNLFYKNDTDIQKGGFLVNGVFTTYSGVFVTGYIPITCSDYVITKKSTKLSLSSANYVTFYDYSKTRVGGGTTTIVDNNDGTVKIIIDSSKTTIAYMRINNDLDYFQTFMIVKNQPYPIKYEDYYNDISLSNDFDLNTTQRNSVIDMINGNKNSVLDGRVLLFSGDSICYGAGWRIPNEQILTQHPDMDKNYYNTGWSQIIAENNPSATVYGYGVGGTRIQKQDGRTDSILERIEVMRGNADYVILHGGANDCFNKLPLGTVVCNNNTADYNPSTINLDEYSYAGALEKLFIRTMQKYPNAKIGFILTLKNTDCEHSNYGAFKLSEYMKIARQVCEKWGVPYLDLFNESGVNTGINNTLYFQNGDKTHPNELCYRTHLAPKIESWIKSL